MTEHGPRRNFRRWGTAVTALFVVSALVLSGCAQKAPPATAPTDQGPFAKFKKEGVIRVGLADQLPYSGVSPDGRVTGIAPTVVETIMKKFGVQKIEPVVVPYGDLIPGLQAGRWDIIGASFSMTKERCGQVKFADPVVFDGGSIAYLMAKTSAPPKTIKEIGAGGFKVGILKGSTYIKQATDLGVPESLISQFPDNLSLADGLNIGRVDIVLASFAAMGEMKKRTGDKLQVTFPLSDSPPRGSSIAFRPNDTQMLEAFQKELRSMKESGEFDTIQKKFGFNMPTEMTKTTSDQACAQAS